MAKILFVTQKLTANSLNQIEILRRSGHEFTVLTSQSEKNCGLSHNETLYYFSRWNFLELVKFLPSFMIINPDIVHIFVDSTSSVKTADFFASLSHMFGKIFSVQFFLSEENFFKMRKTQRLVYSADIVTGPHRTFLFHLRGMSAKNKYQIKGVIPPILRINHGSNHSSTSHDGSNSDSSNPAKGILSDPNQFPEYQIIVPLKKDFMNTPVVARLAERFSILFTIEDRLWSAHDIKKFNHTLSHVRAKPWRLFPVSTENKNLRLLPNGDFVLWLAGLDFELEECIQYFELCLNRKMNIVMDHLQMQYYPDIWENNPMAVIAQKNQILNFILQFTLPKFNRKTADEYDEPLDTASLVDISVNEFNRLIAKATTTQNEKAV